MNTKNLNSINPETGITTHSFSDTPFNADKIKSVFKEKREKRVSKEEYIFYNKI